MSGNNTWITRKNLDRLQCCIYIYEKMIPEKIIRMEIEILDGQSSRLFSNEIFEKRPVMTIEEFDFDGLMLLVLLRKK